MRLICGTAGLTPLELLRRIGNGFNTLPILDQSAKMAFYFLLSVFPLLIVLISLAGILLQSGPAVQQELQKYVSTVMPASALQLVERILNETIQSSGRGKLSLALVFALWTASGGMVALMEGLDTAYGIGQGRPWWKKRLVAVALTVFSLGLILLSLLLMIYGGPLIRIAGRYLGLGAAFIVIWNIFQWIVLIVLILLAFNILYIYAPIARPGGCRWLMPGTVVGVGIWLAVSFAFKLYLQFFDRYSVTYGSIGAVIILLMWFYLTGTAILVGGVVNSEVEKAAGSVSGA